MNDNSFACIFLTSIKVPFTDCFDQRKNNAAKKNNKKQGGKVIITTKRITETQHSTSRPNILPQPFCSKTALSKWQLRLPTDKIDTPDSTAINLLSWYHFELSFTNYLLRAFRLTACLQLACPKSWPLVFPQDHGDICFSLIRNNYVLVFPK